MKLDPYVRVDDTPFCASAEQVMAEHGRPLHRVCNDVGLQELDYGHTVFRFQLCGRLEEITTRAPVLWLGGVAVPWRSLAEFVQAQDDRSFERMGFVVSPRYGVAFVPDASTWITALAEHAVDEWRRLPLN